MVLTTAILLRVGVVEVLLEIVGRAVNFCVNFCRLWTTPLTQRAIIPPTLLRVPVVDDVTHLALDDGGSHEINFMYI